MGMYTEIFFRATLKCDVPEEVMAPIRAMFGESDVPPEDLPKHPLFECPRWDMLALGSSYYFPEHARSALVMDDIRKAWSVAINADVKDYHHEIEKFFDWIDPYVDAAPGEFIGYSLYEEVEPNTPPNMYYKKAASV